MQQCACCHLLSPLPTTETHNIQSASRELFIKRPEIDKPWGYQEGESDPSQVPPFELSNITTRSKRHAEDLLNDLTFVVTAIDMVYHFPLILLGIAQRSFVSGLSLFKRHSRRNMLMRMHGPYLPSEWPPCNTWSRPLGPTGGMPDCPLTNCCHCLWMWWRCHHR